MNNLATSTNGSTFSVTQALSDYQQKSQDLNRMINNLGGGATQKAVQNYINQHPDFKTAEANLQACAHSLANDIAQLEALPPGLKTPQVDSSLASMANNQSVRQALGFALANDPVSVLGADGEIVDALAKFAEVGKSSTELAHAIGPLYLKEKLEPQLLRSLQGLKPGSTTGEVQDALEPTLQRFMDQHPILANLAGVNGRTTARLAGLFTEVANTNAATLEKLQKEYRHGICAITTLIEKHDFSRGYARPLQRGQRSHRLP